MSKGFIGFVADIITLIVYWLSLMTASSRQTDEDTTFIKALTRRFLK